MSYPGRGSRVVFVGNIPYDMSEEQLMDVFKEVGKVVGFRLVFDRNTGKPKGYGFCEFEDPETAASAVRNLDQVEIRGRPLRISTAEEDPLFEGKSTNMGQVDDDTAAARERMKAAGFRRGPPGVGGGGGMGFGMGGGGGGMGGYGMGGGMGPGMGGPGGMMGGPGGPQVGMMGGPPPFGPKQDAGWGRGPAPGGFPLNAGPPQLPPNLPQGTPLPPGVGSTDAISQTLASLPPAQLLDIMSQTKALASTHPDQARTLLNGHPQLAYALFQAMLMMNVVDPAILQRILASSGALSGPGGFDPSAQAGGYQATPPQGRPPAPAPHYGGGPPGAGYPGGQYGGGPPAGPGGMGGYGSPHLQQQQQQQPTYAQQPQQTTPVGAPAAPVGAPGGGVNLPSDQQELLMQVLQLTDEQINALPPDQRAGIMQLRAQMGR